MPIQGAKEHAARLKAIRSPTVQRQIGRAMFTVAVEIQKEARLLITTGSMGGKDHVPSRPGEPPNEDLGGLNRNIEAVRTGPLTSQVESRARYAAWLELGTSRMAARPYMRPATAKKKTRAVELVEAVIEQAIRTG